MTIGHGPRPGSPPSGLDAPPDAVSGDRKGSDVFVLSGGAARGAVQAGMLEALLDAGIRPAGFVGASVGALNACFMAAEPTPERAAALRDTWLRITRHDIFPGRHVTRLGYIARHRSSLYSSHGLARLVRDWSAVERLEELPVPMRVTTTHLASGRAVYHGTGRLDQLLLASAAVPAIFAPVPLPDHAAGEPSPHIDGGIADNVPVAGVPELLADLAAPLRRVFVLDASVPVRLEVPRSPIHVLVASLGVAMRVRPMPELGPGVGVHHLRTADLGVRMNDFSRSAEHVDLGRRAVDELLAGTPTLAA